MGLTTPEKLDEFAREKFPDYTPEELEQLKDVYSPQQMEALKAAEAAVDPRDMTIQGRMRDDPYRFRYLEDFSVVRPVIDLKPEEPDPTPQKAEFLGDKEYIDDFVGKLTDKFIERADIPAGQAWTQLWDVVKKVKGIELDLMPLELAELEKNPNDPELRKKFLVDESENPRDPADWSNDPEYIKMIQELKDQGARLEAQNQDGDGDAFMSRLDTWKFMDSMDPKSSALAPELGKVPGVEGLYATTADPEDDGLDDAGEYRELKRVTGMKVREILSIYTKILVTRYVHNQTRLGKIRSASIIAIAGNGNGRLGIGQAKSTDSIAAMNVARMLAIRNMQPIRRYEDRTIYGTVKAKISGTVVELRARPPGFGLRVSHRIFEMCRAAGIHDMSAVIPRSRNPMNTVKAVFHALLNQPDPEIIATGRGKKLVDVRKVYYGGAVY